jgi:RNA recognition motif-containing protein
MDYKEGVHRGFCFVEFQEAEDAEEAIFNMDGGELLGRTIKVSLAQANQVNKFTASSSNEAIWKSDDWFQTHAGGGQDEASRKLEQERVQDVQTLQEN